MIALLDIRSGVPFNKKIKSGSARKGSFWGKANIFGFQKQFQVTNLCILQLVATLTLFAVFQTIIIKDQEQNHSYVRQNAVEYEEGKNYGSP